MPFNFYDTHTLLMAVQQLTPAATFLRDRYFPTNDASDIFATDDVLVEGQDATRSHEGRGVAFHIVAGAQDGDAALARGHQRRERHLRHRRRARRVP